MDDDAACGWCGAWLADFDTKRVPVSLHALLDPARRWGVSDDGHRSMMVSTATRTDVEALVRTVDSVDIDLVDDWLTGPEANAEEPTDEYVAVSARLMAADGARIVLQR